MIRELGITVALCYLITLGLLRCIAVHLAVFGPPATQCGAQSGSDFRAYQRALDNVSHADVLKVTTGCSVAAFALLELCMLLARRAGIPCGVDDVERNAASESIHPPDLPEKHLEKQYVFIFFSVRLIMTPSNSQVF
jgi:hypothetical protein